MLFRNYLETVKIDHNLATVPYQCKAKLEGERLYELKPNVKDNTIDTDVCVGVK